MNDASIPLQVQAPAQANPLGTIAGLMQIKEGQARQALQASQIRQADANTATIEERTRSAERANQAYSKVSELLKDPAVAAQVGAGDISILQRNGIDPKVVNEVHTGIQGRIKDALLIDKDKAALNATYHEQIAKALDGLTATYGNDPEALKANWGPTVNNLIAEGALKKGTFPDTIEGLDTIKQIAAQNSLFQGINKAALERRESTAKVDKAEADALIAGKLNAGTNAAGLSAEKQAEIAARAVTAAEHHRAGTEAARHNTVTEAETGRHDKAGESVNRAELELRNKEYQQKYGDVLGQMSPSNKAIAEKLAAGEFDPAQLGRMSGKEQIIAGAIAMNPNWTPQAYATKKAFTDPEKGQAKNLGTISRIVGHIGRFEENSKKMGFSPLYASGVNLTGEQNKLHEDSHAIAGELEKLVSGGVGSIEQTKAWQKSLSSPSASARQQAIDEISQLIGSQYEGMNQTYKAGIGTELPIEKYVNAAGQKWMKAKGIKVSDSAGVKLVAPDGTTSEVPADQVDHYLKLGAKKAGR